MRYQARRAAKSARERRRRWLPLALMAAGLVVLAGAVWAILGSGGSGGQVAIEVTGAPRLKADKPRVDLGDIRLGRTVEVSFQLSNVGDQPLTLTEAPYVTVAEGC
jgi:hypothetical protein